MAAYQSVTTSGSQGDLTHEQGLRIIDEFFSSPLSPLSARNLASLPPKSRETNEIGDNVELIVQPGADGHIEARSLEADERDEDGHLLISQGQQETDDDNEIHHNDKIHTDRELHPEEIDDDGLHDGETHSNNYAHDHISTEELKAATRHIEATQHRQDDELSDETNEARPDNEFPIASSAGKEGAYAALLSHAMNKNTCATGKPIDGPLKLALEERLKIAIGEKFKVALEERFRIAFEGPMKIALEERFERNVQERLMEILEILFMRRQLALGHAFAFPPGLDHEQLPRDSMPDATVVLDMRNSRKRARSVDDCGYDSEPLLSNEDSQRRSRKRMKLTRRSSMDVSRFQEHGTRGVQPPGDKDKNPEHQHVPTYPDLPLVKPPLKPLIPFNLEGKECGHLPCDRPPPNRPLDEPNRQSSPQTNTPHQPSSPSSDGEQQQQMPPSMAMALDIDAPSVPLSTQADKEADVDVDSQESLTHSLEPHSADELYNSGPIDQLPKYRPRHDSVAQFDNPPTTTGDEKHNKLCTGQHSSPDPEDTPSPTPNPSTPPTLLQPVIYTPTPQKSSHSPPPASPLTTPPSPKKPSPKKSSPRRHRHSSPAPKRQTTPAPQSRWNRELLALSGRRAPPTPQNRRQTRASLSALQDTAPDAVGVVKSRSRRKAMR